MPDIGSTAESLTNMRAHLGDAVKHTAYTGDRVVITRNGKPVAGLVDLVDLARLDADDMRQR